MRPPRFARLLGALALLLIPGLLFAEGKRQRRDDKAPLLRGTISQIDPDRKEVTVHAPDKDWQMAIDDGSRLRVAGRAASLTDFKKGMRVRVRYETKDGKKVVVRMRTPVVAQTLAVVMRKAFQGVASRAYDTRGEMQKRLEDTLQDIDERIEDMEEQSKNATGEERKRIDADVKVLKEKRDAVREKLKQVKTAPPDKWESVRNGLKDALDQYQKAYERTHKDVKESPEK